MDLISLATALGLGAVLKALADWALNRRRNDTDLTRMAVEITASVMTELRTELEDTRAELIATRAELAQTHREVEDLRAALAEARAELAIYRKANQ